MQLSLPNLHRVLAATFVATLALGGWVRTAQAQSSLEFDELQDTLRTAYAKIQALEAQGGNQSAAAQNAAASAAEAEQLRERYTELRGLLEALGISALETDRDETTERLLTALREMRLMEAQKNRLATALQSLVDASAAFSQVARPGNPESVNQLSAAMDKARTALSANQSEKSQPGQLADAKIVSVKPDLGVAILNVGVDSGAKPGMPFAVYRGDRPIANVLVTDVRQTLSGAIVRELFSAADPIQVGDIGRVDTNHSN